MNLLRTVKILKLVHLILKVKYTERQQNLDDFETENLFIPGVGTPYAMITSEAMLINIKKASAHKIPV